MVRFLLLRHGTSVNNVAKRSTGHYDTPLTEEGREQARRAGAYICQNYPVDAIWSSDLSRARDTAAPVAEALGLEVRLRKDLRELDVGIFQNRPFEQNRLEYPEEYEGYRLRNQRCPGGECFSDLAARAQKALAEIAAQHEGQTVLIATHSGLIRTLLCLWDGKDILEIKDCPGLHNASLTVVEYDGGVVRVVERDVYHYLD